MYLSTKCVYKSPNLLQHRIAPVMRTSRISLPLPCSMFAAIVNSTCCLIHYVLLYLSFYRMPSLADSAVVEVNLNISSVQALRHSRIRPNEWHNSCDIATVSPWPTKLSTINWQHCKPDCILPVPSEIDDQFEDREGGEAGICRLRFSCIPYLICFV